MRNKEGNKGKKHRREINRDETTRERDGRGRKEA